MMNDTNKSCGCKGRSSTNCGCTGASSPKAGAQVLLLVRTAPADRRAHARARVAARRSRRSEVAS